MKRSNCDRLAPCERSVAPLAKLTDGYHAEENWESLAWLSSQAATLASGRRLSVSDGMLVFKQAAAVHNKNDKRLVDGLRLNKWSISWSIEQPRTGAKSSTRLVAFSGAQRCATGTLSCLYEANDGSGFKRPSLRGGLTGKLSVNFRPEVNGESHQSSLRLILRYLGQGD